MGLADEGQQVMFAQRVQLDVGDDDHFIVVGGEQRAVDDLFHTLFIAVTQVLHGLGRAQGVSSRPSRSGSSPRPMRISR
jgi:hypothetical protein